MAEFANTDPCPVGLRGIVPSLNTPFTAQDRIDRASLRRQVDGILAAGCAGMLINAVAGESGSLTLDEKQRVLDTVLEHTAGRVPVIAGVSSEEPAQRLALARMARQAGAEWMLCQPPSGASGTALEGLLGELCAAGPPNLMLQDLDFAGPGLPLEEIAALFQRVPAFRALKIETLPAGPKYSAVLEATGGRLHVSGGWAVQQLPDALRRGVHAFIPSTMEPLYCRIYAHFAAGREAEAQALFEALLPVLAFAHSHIHVALRFFKRLRAAEGVFATDAVRPPVPPLDAYQQAEADRLIGRVLALQARMAQAK